LYKHILIPTDGSECAAKGVDHGLSLAKALGAQVTIVTVTEPMPVAVGAPGMGFDPGLVLADYDKHAENVARSVLEGARKAAEEKGVAVETFHAPRSHPAEAIVEAAKARGCDLIVMASHGRRGVRRLLLGSQTAEVVGHSEMPVLVVR
jgi:nucleotide-binding universal stress UspA family protein